ncbi:Phosphatidylinositol-3-phosphatase SAC1 [Rhodotorula toruloides]
MSDNGSRTADARSERAGSIHSNYSHDSHRERPTSTDPDAERARREADREFERERDRDRESSRRHHRGSSREYDYDRYERGGGSSSGRRSRSGYEDEEYYRSSKRRRSRSRERRGLRYDERYERDYDRRDDRRSRREPSYEAPRRRRSPSYEAPPPRGGRSPSPQLSEEQREMRTVFVSQLAARVTDRELGIFFENFAGKVRDARVIVDKITRRSKGVGYVEFVELETVQKALTLSGTKLLGIPIQVQYTEAEKNRQAREGAAGGGSSAPMTGGLYVGSLNFALTSDDIREVFQPFGELETVELHRDPVTGKSKGYCFVKFKKHEDAMVAIEKMNNFPLAGREIKVGLVADKSATFSQHLGQQDLNLEREEGGTGKLDANARMDLMQKLARIDRPPDLPPTPMFRPNIPQNQTRNVLLKNAFNPEEETERDWDTDLADDVKTECENKYGKVVDIFVIKESPEGEIYIRFDTTDTAAKAVQGLNNRWFGGRTLVAGHCGDSLFNAARP